MKNSYFKMTKNSFTQLLQLSWPVSMTLVALIIGLAPNGALAQRKSVINDSYGPGSSAEWQGLWHQSGNYRLFLNRAPIGWTNCWVAGKGGPTTVEGFSDSVPGLEWLPWTGGEMIRRAGTNGFDIVMHYSDGTVDFDAVDWAANHGCAVFCFADNLQGTQGNTYHYFDYGLYGPTYSGRGPTPAMIVTGGYSPYSDVVTAYGEQGEFMDATEDIGLAVQSFSHSSTAARYARIKDTTGWTNVFDLRQALRQVSSFYDTGWQTHGGYGFPLLSNRFGHNREFTEKAIPALTNLDAGPPIQPRAQISSCGTNVTFYWYNFRQTGFSNTIVKVDGVTVYAGSGTSHTWTPSQPGTHTADFYTQLSDGRISRNAIDVALEPYTQVVFKHMRTNCCCDCATLAFDALTASNFTCTVLGPDNSYWNLYESSDLQEWTLVGGVTLSGYPQIFTRNDLSGVNYRFYRVSNGECCSQPIGFTRKTYSGTSTNLIANQLDADLNTLNGLFNPMANGATLPNGSQIKKWNGSDFDVYTWSGGAWDDGSPTLNPGEGAILINPSTNAVTVAFAGLVREGTLNNSLAAGANLVSSMLPKAGGVSSVLGYVGHYGDQAQKWNGSDYDAFTFVPPGNWSSSEPSMDVQESFWLVLSTNREWQIENPHCSGTIECTRPTFTWFASTMVSLRSNIFKFRAHAPAGTVWDIYRNSDLDPEGWTYWQTVQFYRDFGDSVDMDASDDHRFYRFSLSNAACCSPVIGYTRKTYDPASTNIITDHLVYTANTLNSLFGLIIDAFGFAEDVQIQKWNGSSLDTYTWTSTSGWSPNGNATLNPGEGAIFINPSTNYLTLGFVGQVQEGSLDIPLASGFSLVGSILPKTGGITSNLGYNPHTADKVLKWNQGIGDYDQYTYFPTGPAHWGPSEPNIGMNEGFWFKLISTNNWHVDFDPCE